MTIITPDDSTALYILLTWGKEGNEDVYEKLTPAAKEWFDRQPVTNENNQE